MCAYVCLYVGLCVHVRACACVPLGVFWGKCASYVGLIAIPK